MTLFSPEPDGTEEQERTREESARVRSAIDAWSNQGYTALRLVALQEPVVRDEIVDLILTDEPVPGARGILLRRITDDGLWVRTDRGWTSLLHRPGASTGHVTLDRHGVPWIERNHCPACERASTSKVEFARAMATWDATRV